MASPQAHQPNQSNPEGTEQVSQNLPHRERLHLTCPQDVALEPQVVAKIVNAVFKQENWGAFIRPAAKIFIARCATKFIVLLSHKIKPTLTPLMFNNIIEVGAVVAALNSFRFEDFVQSLREDMPKELWPLLDSTAADRSTQPAESQTLSSKERKLRTLAWVLGQSEGSHEPLPTHVYAASDTDALNDQFASFGADF
ncbi:hypothetical protein NA57DRAFT_75228 [Rhizodiscina lignyota]|uniref:Uncharacterized protein n=1 Tax=Rhizodiscina lignyota TaxID=1504668 RepID=A0A9P4II72_9PEZI|nr:hypothetical protein NA57DRAFT_75228 [Rhizodiscina lignyota]